MNTTELRQHPLGAEMPPPSDEDYEQLKKSIAEQGFSSMHPIVLFEEMVLDGFSRHLACLEVGVKGEYMHFIAPDMANSAEDFVYQENVPRRHLTAGQRAGIADALAAKRLARQLDEDESALNSSSQVLTNPTVEASIEDAAKVMHVSPDSVKKVRALRKSDPEAAEEVRKGRKTLNEASAASGNKNAAHGAAVKRIESVLGESWVAKTKLKHRELVEMSGLVEEEMKRIEPYLREGWSLKSALGHTSVSLTAGHSIRDLYTRAIEFGKYVLQIDGWEISVKKEKA